MADVASLIFAAIGSLAWIICLGGIASISSVNGISQSDTALAWWTLWFQFGLLVFSILVSVGACSCARLRTDMYLMCNVLWMLVAWGANQQLDNPAVKGKLEESNGALMAGCVIILFFNMLQHIYWGVTDNGTAPIQLGRKTEAGDKGAEAAPGSTPSSAAPSPTKPSVEVVV